MKSVIIIIMLLCTLPVKGSEAICGLMERMAPGLSKRIQIEIKPDSVDFFEIAGRDGLPLISANNDVNAAMGLHWYLKHYCGVHMCWNNLRPSIPAEFHVPEGVERYDTKMAERYYLNYCTHSYSMAFWDWGRWEKEIDWMALHGINMPLCITGMEIVWERVLRRLGYDDEGIRNFIAGGAFKAWWLMNNLEGWGGNVSRKYIDAECELQKKILKRMREFGMKPVLAGYSGMLPHNADSVCGVRTAESGLWLGFRRPAFLSPTDERFEEISGIYYEEMNNLYGPAEYYSADPFHEGGNSMGYDLAEAAGRIYAAMQKASKGSKWVVQGWQENPKNEILDALEPGSVVVLDLQAESQPMWNSRKGSFHGHDWLYCMLLNFGGNVGMYGKMDSMADGFAKAKKDAHMHGIGFTMEGIENNPVMYELMSELPWIDDMDVNKWVSDYTKMRYGKSNLQAEQAWELLARSIYNSPADSIQQGCVESVFCARPADDVRDVSSWASSKNYYDFSDVERAAELLESAADELCNNVNFQYDLTDVKRQVIANEGRRVANQLCECRDKAEYIALSERFMNLMARQDSLLSQNEWFNLDKWINDAKAKGCVESALRQITTWGGKEAADKGGLHDYAHREWAGLIKNYYMPRWRKWFDERVELWDSGEKPQIDFYELENSLINQLLESLQ